MKTHQIDSQYRIGARLPLFEEGLVKNEPMLFSATPRFAWDNGGPITRAFLAAAFNITLADEARWVLRDSKCGNYCFDSRVHMLMPGWWPCIPGWHHDDVPRSREDSQPNYDSPEYKSKHILALVNGDICPTEFATGCVEMPDIPVGEGPIYKHWHNAVEEHVAAGRLVKTSVPTNRLIHFNNHSFHKGVPAAKGGWRWFGRLSWDAGYEQGRPHFNEIRRQCQVYLEHPMEGW